MVMMVVGYSCDGCAVIGEKSGCFDCVVVMVVVYCMKQLLHVVMGVW